MFAKKNAPRGILSGEGRPRTPARGVSLALVIAWGAQNGINQYFDYHIRDQRGRFTLEDLYSKSFFEFSFLNTFLMFGHIFDSQLCLNLIKALSILDLNFV